MSKRDSWRNRIVGSGVAPASEFLAHELNWRIHPRPQADALAGVLSEVGWVQTVIVNRRTSPEWGTQQGIETLVDGHLRVMEALGRGDDEPVPWVAVDISPAEERLVLATLDPLSAMAVADTAKLDELLRDVATGDAAVQAMLAELAERAGLDYGKPEPAADPGAQVDRAEELREKWATARGQVWQVGRHRLMCGDSTDAGDVERLMGGEKAQLCFTSPPYWVGKDYETQTSLAEVKGFIRQIAAIMAEVVTRDGGRIVVNTSTARAQAINPKADVETLFALTWWQDALREHDWLMRHCRLWVKRGQMAAPSVAARSDVVDQHWETVATFLPTFYCPDGLRRGQEKIGMKWAQQGVWDDIPGEAKMDTHGAAFPVELPRRYMMLYCTDAEIVFEPFTGTGTTFVASEGLNRSCRGLELDPAFAAVSLERLSGMGLEPRLTDA